VSTSKRDSRLSGAAYRREIENVTLQFELIRFVVKKLTEKDKKIFFGDLAVKKLEGIEKFRAFMKEKSLLPTEEADRQAEMLILDNRREQRRRIKTKVLHYVEFSEDKLNQSEVLLLVAHFESFMRLVHETFLSAAPHKVFGTAFRGKQGSRVGLREVFNVDAQAWSPSKFLKELITKEVKWLDAQGIQQKVTYFEKHFAISFGNTADIKALKEIMQRRNQISHEIFESGKSDDEMLKERLGEGKEPPLVSDDMLRKARKLFHEIPKKCIEAGAKAYQSHFRHY